MYPFQDPENGTVGIAEREREREKKREREKERERERERVRERDQTELSLNSDKNKHKIRPSQIKLEVTCFSYLYNRVHHFKYSTAASSCCLCRLRGIEWKRCIDEIN